MTNENGEIRITLGKAANASKALLGAIQELEKKDTATSASIEKQRRFNKAATDAILEVEIQLQEIRKALKGK